MSMPAFCALLALASAAVSSVAAQSHGPTNLVSTGAAAAVTNRLSAIPEAESRADLHVALSGTPEQRTLLLGKLKQRDDPRLSAWLVDVLNNPDTSFTSEAARMLVDMQYSGANALDGFVRLLKPERGP